MSCCLCKMNSNHGTFDSQPSSVSLNVDSHAGISLRIDDTKMRVLALIMLWWMHAFCSTFRRETCPRCAVVLPMKTHWEKMLRSVPQLPVVPSSPCHLKARELWHHRRTRWTRSLVHPIPALYTRRLPFQTTLAFLFWWMMHVVLAI